MSEIPGLPADIYFRDVGTDAPDNWRELMPDVDDPEAADEDDANTNLLRSLYGYSPDWFGQEPEEAQQFATIEDSPESMSAALGATFQRRLDQLLKKKRPSLT